MSNCIRISNHVVTFSHLDIDIPRFHAFMTSIPKEQPGFDSDSKIVNAWWFLESNTWIQDGMRVIIAFGEGHSIHTNRDFRYVINGILKDFMLRKKAHTFILKDEFDGFRQSFRTPVVFGRDDNLL